MNKEDLKSKLSDEQYWVTQEKGTEMPFSGAYWNSKDEGAYLCICCDEPLFESGTKYDSGTGWPSFWEPLDKAKINTTEDTEIGMVRVEITCAGCGAHLGHVFPDGPKPSGLRYCVNSASLRLQGNAEDSSA